MMAAAHIHRDTEQKCANCGHHHCRDCRICIRCGCIDYKRLKHRKTQ